MNQHSPLKARGSLLERAAAVYDFNAAIRAPVVPERPQPAPVEPEVSEPNRIEEPAQADAGARKRRKKPIILTPPDELSGAELMLTDPALEAEIATAETPLSHSEDAFPFPLSDMDAPSEPWRQASPATPSRHGTVDREALLEAGFILPDAPVSALAEEFRIIKRQLLLKVSGHGNVAEDKRQTILVCSAQPDEGKTFCAVNLALSLAGERDVEVLLVDGDFAKPEILSILGLEGGPGFIDAISDPDLDANSLVIGTDIRGLSVLPAGSQANNVTELLASARTREVLADLTRGHPRRVVIFDSPPALMASPASVLAAHVGQVVMVVRADQTTEADLKEAVALLSGCDHVSLMLNGTGLAVTGRRFGAYYGYGQ